MTGVQTCALPILRKNPEEKKFSLTEKQYFDLHTYPEIIRNFLKDKPEYHKLEESIDCLRLQSISRCFKYRYFDCAKERSREALNIINKYPDLSNVAGKNMKRLFHVFSVSERFGKLMSKLLL